MVELLAGAAAGGYEYVGEAAEIRWADLLCHGDEVLEDEVGGLVRAVGPERRAE
ncbi:hypothetical protein [Streptomyces cyaneofuscatus]|uniref:hypothetical protein n=1 Tax=Streptomyces cyaneofuscatus TaxID=66883 RepID=UPI003668DE19